MLNSFQWIAEGVDLPLVNFARIEEWIIRVAKSHDRMVGELSYVFCDDETILRINRKFLDHDYYTDIITFDSTRGKLIQGDIYISLETVRSNADHLNIPYDLELMRVIIHGVLHLCGIDDKGPGEREIMQQNEDVALNILATIS